MTVPYEVKRERMLAVARSGRRAYGVPISLVSPSLHARITARGMEPNATKRQAVLRGNARRHAGMTLDQAHDMLRGTIRQLETAGFEVMGDVYGGVMVVRDDGVKTAYAERGVAARPRRS